MGKRDGIFGTEKQLLPIEKFLKNDGWEKGSGPDYYYPKEYPHLHLGLKSEGSSKDVSNYKDVKDCINFLAFSYGLKEDKPKSTQIYEDGKIVNFNKDILFKSFDDDHSQKLKTIIDEIT